MTNLVFDVLWRDRGAAKGLTDLGNRTARAEQSFTKLKVAAGIALVATGAAIVKFGADSVRAYSEAQASQAQLSLAFQKFPKLADVSITSLRNYNSALELKTKYDDDAIASGQAVLAQFGLTGKQLTQLTPLLLDYASRTGKDLPTAARDLGKAFDGQTRAIKDVGINYKSTGNKAQDFANITALLSQKVGGFAENEGKTAAGQLAILRNEFGELQEAVGAKLVPALTQVTHTATDLVVALGDNADTIVPLVAGVGGLAAVIWTANKAQAAWKVTQELTAPLAAKAVGGLNAMKVAFTGVELSAEASGKAMRIAQLSIPVVGALLFAATTAMAVWASKTDVGTDTTNDFASAMESVKGNVTLATAALNENVRAQAVNSLMSSGAFKQAQQLGISYSDLTDAALGNKGAIDRVNDGLRAGLALNPQVSKANSDQRNAAEALSQSINGVAHESRQAAEDENVRRAAMQQSTPATLTLSDAQKQLKTASNNLQSELQKVINKLTILKQGALDQEQADIQWEDSLDNLTSSVKENGHSLDIHTEKGRNNRKAIIGAMQALNDKTVADYKNAAGSKDAAHAVEQANKRYQDNKRDLERAATAAGYSKRQVHDMIKQYLKTPKQLMTEIKTKGVKDALGQLKTLKTKIEDLKSQLILLKIQTSSNYKKVKHDFDIAFPHGRMASGGVLPGYTPGRDVHRFVSPTGGRLDLSGGEAVMRPEWTKAVGGAPAVARMNKAAQQGKLGQMAFADGGVVNRSIMLSGKYGMRGSLPSNRDLHDMAATVGGYMGPTIAGAFQSYYNSWAKKNGAGTVAGGGYARALKYARAHVGHPYVFGSLWDCSGFMSALQSIILGQQPHRRYTTTAFHGSHAQGFTRGKRSPFMVGVRPLSGKLGHMAGTLNGVNVESAGGVGVRVGGRARGYNNGMFSWRGGMANGGVIGDLPFDLLDPRGQYYNPVLAAALGGGIAQAARGGLFRRPALTTVAERGPERVLSAQTTQSFDRFVQSPIVRGGGDLAAALSGVTVMVENPWTGEYHEAKMRTVADGRISTANRRATQLRAS